MRSLDQSRRSNSCCGPDLPDNSNYRDFPYADKLFTSFMEEAAGLRQAFQASGRVGGAFFAPPPLSNIDKTAAVYVLANDTLPKSACLAGGETSCKLGFRDGRHAIDGVFGNGFYETRYSEHPISLRASAFGSAFGSGKRTS